MVTLEDVKQSNEPKEINVEWEIDDEVEEIPFKLKPMTYGETLLIAKKGEVEGKDQYSLQYDLLTSIIKKKNENDNWARITRKDLEELPQGFVVKLTEQVNDFLGLGEEVENFRSSLANQKKLRQ